MPHCNLFNKLSLVALILSLLSSQASSLGQMPTAAQRDGMWGTSNIHYETLSRPPVRKGTAQPRTWAPEVVRPVAPYSYGWFGSSPSKTWYRQFGHQGAYTNYSLR